MKTLKNKYFESNEEIYKLQLFIEELKKLDNETLDENVLKKIKKSIVQRYKELSLRMKKVARSAIAKFKRKRTQTRKKDSGQLLQAAQRQAKMTIIKKQLGPEIKYKELPIHKRIQINQKIVAKKKKAIDKLSKKIFRQLRAKEGERVAKAKQKKKEMQ